MGRRKVVAGQGRGRRGGVAGTWRATTAASEEGGGSAGRLPCAAGGAESLGVRESDTRSGRPSSLCGQREEGSSPSRRCSICAVEPADWMVGGWEGGGSETGGGEDLPVHLSDALVGIILETDRDKAIAKATPVVAADDARVRAVVLLEPLIQRIPAQQPALRFCSRTVSEALWQDTRHVAGEAAGGGGLTRR